MKKVISAFVILLCLTACSRDPNVAKKKYLENGNKYYERGKYKEALIMYSNALKRDMRYGEAYYRLALAKLKLGQYAGAARDLQRAVELQPDNLDAHVRLTNLFLNAYLGDRKRPKQIYTELKGVSDKLSQRFRNSYDDVRVKGYLALFDGDPNKALGFFEQANKIKPYQPDLVLVYMQTLAMVNKADEGEKLATELLKRDPSALTVYDALYLQFMRSNRVADAERILKSKVENNPKVPEAYLQLAAYYYGTKNHPEMMATLDRMSSKPKDFPHSQVNVGDFFLRIHKKIK